MNLNEEAFNLFGDITKEKYIRKPLNKRCM